MMRHPSILYKYLGLLLLFFICSHLTAQEGYDIKVEIDGYYNDDLLLGYRMGGKTYIMDTLYTRDPKGYFQFKGDTVLDGGIYIIVIKPGNEYFEFVIPSDDEQHFTLRTELIDGDMSQNLSVDGSKENHMFIEYTLTLAREGKKPDSCINEKTKFEETLKENKASNIEELKNELESLNDELNSIDVKVESVQDNMISNFPEYLISSLILAYRVPDIPETITDSEAKYYYYKEHYWDQFDWSDQRLIRTPILEQKIEYYLDKLTFAQPDSQIVACDLMMSSALKGGNKDIYQYVASYTLNKYAKSKLICMDKVYVHIGATYYCGAIKPEWIEEVQLNKICKNVEQLKDIVCGSQAPPIQLTDITTGREVSLYNIKKKYTLIYFWDTNCSNCKKTSKSLLDVYQKWKDSGFEIYGVCTNGTDNIENVKTVISNAGMSWINITGEANTLDQVKINYNNTANPYLFLLNADKEILYKRFSADQLDSILESEFGGSK